MQPEVATIYMNALAQSQVLKAVTSVCPGRKFIRKSAWSSDLGPSLIAVPLILWLPTSDIADDFDSAEVRAEAAGSSTTCPWSNTRLLFNASNCKVEFSRFAYDHRQIADGFVKRHKLHSPARLP